MSTQPNAYVQSRKTNSLLFIITLVQAVVIAIMALSLSIIFPLQTTELKVVEYITDGGGFVNVLPVDSTIENRAAISEVFARSFLISHEEIIPGRTDENIKNVTSLSTPLLAQEFVLKVEDYYRARNFERRIEIHRTFPTRPGEIRIEFDFVDTTPSGNRDRYQMVAIIDFEYMTQNVRLSGGVFNPTGFVVTNILLSELGVKK